MMTANEIERERAEVKEERAALRKRTERLIFWKGILLGGGVMAIVFLISLL